jgi:hypothetical protein
MLRKLGLLALTFAVGLSLAGCGASTIWADGTLDQGSAAMLTPMAQMNFDMTGQFFNPTSAAGFASVLSGSSFEQLQTFDCHSGTYTEDTTSDGTMFTSYDDCRYNDDIGGYTLQNGALFVKEGPRTYDIHVWTDPTYEVELFDTEGLVLGMYMDMDAQLAESDGGGYALDYFFDLAMDFGESTFSMAFDMTHTYTPENPVDPMAAGTITFSGAMTLRDTSSMTEYNLTMATDDTLHQTGGCIDGGAAVYTDGDDVLRIQVTGCETYSATFNGVAVAAAPLALTSALR